MVTELNYALTARRRFPKLAARASLGHCTEEDETAADDRFLVHLGISIAVAFFGLVGTVCVIVWRAAA
jgi:hypothetical protein